jgi:hypothetical protein
MSYATQHSVGETITFQFGEGPAILSAGTRTSTGFDRSNYLSAVLVVCSGAVTGSPSSFTLDCKIQDSADNSTNWNDYKPDGTNVAKITTLGAANTVANVNVDLHAAKQYIRVVEVAYFPDGTSPTVGSVDVVVLGGSNTEPI